MVSQNDTLEPLPGDFAAPAGGFRRTPGGDFAARLAGISPHPRAGFRCILGERIRIFFPGVAFAAILGEFRNTFGKGFRPTLRELRTKLAQSSTR